MAVIMVPMNDGQESMISKPFIRASTTIIKGLIPIDHKHNHHHYAHDLNVELGI